ncbi:MAG: hypothetical protein MK198_05405 [Gracilimonas sp.]|uniref:hypothetical protein n=1 Tax=Gracilimonas sp. TaxID=1974203 RepID=UPI0037513227|nr:hypothetical protein [Gracilimonas sp.]
MNTLKNISKKMVRLALVSIIMSLPFSLFAQQNSLSVLTQKATELGLDASYISKLQERAEANGISNDQLSEILKPAVALAEENLPFDMILQKTSEGMAKGVPIDVLLNVLEGLKVSTQNAAPIVNNWIQKPGVQNMANRSGPESAQEFRNNMLKVTARALNQGFSENVLNGFLDELDNQDLLSNISRNEVVTSLTILPDLPTSAENQQLTTELVIRSLKGGFDSTDLQKLPSAMKIAQNKGQIPAGNVLNGILDRIQSGSPASEILQGLFNGKIGGGPPSGLPGRPDNTRGGNNGGGG